jgi:hypothetical protein
MARALQKITKQGVGYRRPPEIEASIRRALGEDLTEQLRRARVNDPNDPDFMCSECLLHLAREARITGDRRALDKLLPLLLKRCQRRLEKTISGSEAIAGEKREELLNEFGLLLAKAGTNHDSTGLDIFECRFNAGFVYLKFKHQKADRRRENKLRDLSTVRDDEGNLVDPEAFLTRLSRAAYMPANQEDFIFLDEILKAINHLPEAQRSAVLLCGVQGYAPASEEPTEITAATICGISGTAARKNLRKAVAKLNLLRKESQP